MQKPAFLLLATLPLLGVPDEGKQVNVCKIEEGYYAVIREKADTVAGVAHYSHWLNFETGWDKDPVFSSYNLDSLERAAQGYYFRDDSTDLNYHGQFYSNSHPEISFVNRNLGFMYGTNAVYMFYPFIYRTADGGKSWTLLTAKELGSSYVLDRKGFFMFNEKQGIIVWQHAPVGEQTYSLTEDGGATWKLHSIKTGYASGALTSILFAPQGEVTLVFQGAYNQKENANIESAVFKSTDFGKSFRELK